MDEGTKKTIERLKELGHEIEKLEKLITDEKGEEKKLLLKILKTELETQAIVQSNGMVLVEALKYIKAE